MFSYIKGILEIKSTNYVVIDIGGVGFKIFMAESAINKLSETGNEVKIYTHMQVREDDISLYGFNTNEELRMFELLISVSGIGAKSAIAMLSNIEPSTFALAVINDNLEVLTQIPGVGKKSAQRIILELKDKIKQTSSEEIKLQASQINVEILENNNKQEAVEALKVLGYRNTEIEKALQKIQLNTLTVEEIIKQALKILT